MTTITPVPTTSLTLEQRVQALEVKVKTAVDTDAAKVKAWFTANWPHFVTWAGGVYVVLKHL